MINQKEFAATALDSGKKAFVVHMAYLGSKITIDLAWESQITLLITEKFVIPAKYLDYADVFLEKLATELSERTNINKYFIDLELGKQLPYGSIYSLRPVELKTLKTYNKTNLANSFLCPSKSPANIPILFTQKLDGIFCLYIDYYDLNNPIIKNHYSLPLIRESLNYLNYDKQFTRLDLTSAYQ